MKKTLKRGAERSHKRVSVRLSAPVFVFGEKVNLVKSSLLACAWLGGAKRRRYGGALPRRIEHSVARHLYQDKHTPNSHFKF